MEELKKLLWSTKKMLKLTVKIIENPLPSPPPPIEKNLDPPSIEQIISTSPNPTYLVKFCGKINWSYNKKKVL